MILRLTLIVSILLVLSSVMIGQGPAPALPGTFAGAGLSWRRGAAYPLTEDNVFARSFSVTDPESGKKIPTNWYLWTEATTPIAPAPSANNPIVSSIGAGVAYVAASSGRFAAVLIATGSLSATQAAAGASFNGNLGLSIRLVKQIYLMPYLGGSTLTGGVGSGTFVAQPGFRLLFGIGK